MRCHNWKRWESIILEYSGENKLEPHRPDEHIERKSWLCRKFGIRTTTPNNHSWLTIHFTPNSRNLIALQDMVETYFNGDYGSLTKKFCLNRTEITWDFFCNHANEVDCQNIIRRLAYRLISLQDSNSGNRIPALYRFTRCFTDQKFDTWRELVDENGKPFASYDDCLLKTNKGNEAEGKGDFSIYEQAYQMKSKGMKTKEMGDKGKWMKGDDINKGKSIFEMKYNPNSQTKTKLYSKRLQDIWVVRIEMTWNQLKIKNDLRFDYRSFPSILDEVSKFRFTDFWEFREIDFNRFYYDLFSTQLDTFRDNYPLKNLIKEARQYSTTDKIRVMREATSNTDKKFKYNAINRYSRIISFEDAVNTPIPNNALHLFHECYQDEDLQSYKGTKIIQLHHA